STGVVAKVGEGFSLIAHALDSFQQTNPGSLVGILELDIFGFSRGAAAARHFANQVLQRASGPLGALHRQGTFTPGPDFEWDRDLIINFIGLFDTVAAIGGWEDWADPSDAMNGGIDLHWRPTRPARSSIWWPETNTASTSLSTGSPRHTVKSSCRVPIPTLEEATCLSP